MGGLEFQLDLGVGGLEFQLELGVERLEIGLHFNQYQRGLQGIHLLVVGVLDLIHLLNKYFNML